MYEYISIFGKTVPMYSVMGLVGFLCASVYMLTACKKKRLSFENCIYVAVFGALGAVVGAKVFYVLTVLPDIVKTLSSSGYSLLQIVKMYLSGGMVFYGGLFGAAIAAYLYSKRMNINVKEYAPVLVPAFALVHAFGRLGCFFAGCCYGIRSDTFGIRFYHSDIAPNSVPLFPVQPIEASIEFAIFVFLTLTSNKRIKNNSFYFYMTVYAICRFVLEFFRGDINRGIVCGLSTSQWISIVILIAYAIRFAKRRINKSKKEED